MGNTNEMKKVDYYLVYDSYYDEGCDLFCICENESDAAEIAKDLNYRVRKLPLRNVSEYFKDKEIKEQKKKQEEQQWIQSQIRSKEAEIRKTLLEKEREISELKKRL